MPRLVETFFTEMGRFFQMLWRTLRVDAAAPLRLAPAAAADGAGGGGIGAGGAADRHVHRHGDGAPDLHHPQRFNAEGFVGSLVALSMVRELSPVLAGLIVAGRCGSAMGAELGTMRVTEQIDALEVMATDPVHYLVVPRVWATTITLPMLVVFGNAIGIWGGYLVSVILLGANPVTYLGNTFQYMDTNDFLSGVIKAAVFGLLIAVIGCQKGYYTTGGAEGVGRSTTRAVVLASIAILISDFFLTKLLF